MCGIVGFIVNGQFDGSPDHSPDGSPDRSLDQSLQKMLGRIARRGPDGSGTWSFNAVNQPMGQLHVRFGHRRLSIIDVEGGAQPMQSPTTQSSIVFNGEIFNFRELGRELTASGVKLQTRSDTEVLLELLGQADASSPEKIDPRLRRLNGMFAFGFWDMARSQLLLARDRLGIKPLYYALLGDDGQSGIAFASELTALLEFTAVPLDRRLDPQGLSDYFFQDSVPAPYTMVRGVRKLGIGESLLWRPGHPPEIRHYWDADEIQADMSLLATKSEDALSRELLENLKRAVERQMISDVPVGVFLSGGIDSSVITALAAQVQGAPIETFSIGFEEKSFDESSAAAQVSKHLKTYHHSESLSEKKMMDDLEETLDRLDEPLGDVSILPTYQVAKLARKTVKVCLGGDGGDELFAGYSFYGAHEWGDRYGKLPRWIRNGFIHPLVSSLPVRDVYQSVEWKAKRFTDRWDPSRLRRHLRWLASTDCPELVRLLPQGVAPSSLKRWQERDAESLEALLKLDLRTYLTGSVLTKVDRATMGAGVEARPPFLDNDVVEFALRLPSQFKLKGKVTKYLLKKAAASLLPESILNRKKQGFSVPISRWVRGELSASIRAAAETSELFRSGMLNRKRFEQILKEHEAFDKDWGKTIWSFWVLDHWVRRNIALLKL
jgi:asparagine synthase (glutamine-hydrolysing)